MEQTIFAVGDEPYVLWELNTKQRTREFLNGLDPDFFSYLLQTHMATEDEKRASVALRLALHHATETLFSLLGALVQAPDCPHAWIARCKNSELREVVKRITAADSTLITRWKWPPLGWDKVAELVFDRYEPGSEKRQRTAEGFAKTWRGLAGELLTEAVIDEYNATKHGFRTRHGGFKLEFAPVKTPDVPPADSEMMSLGGSEFGAAFFKVDKFEGKGGRHLHTSRVAVNWSLERDILLLQLAHMSINNVISRLKIANEFAAGACKFLRPESDEDFTRPWTHTIGVTNMTFNDGIKADMLPEISKSEILQKLRESNDEGQ